MTHFQQGNLETMRAKFSKALPLGEQVDKSAARHNHKTMTDLTRQELDAKLAASEAKVEARLANFDTSIKTGFADLSAAMQRQSSELSSAMERQSSDMRIEMAQIRAEMAKQAGDAKAEMANIRGDSHKGTIEVTRWVVGFGIAILGAVITFSKTSDKAPAQPAVQPAPIVITVPNATVPTPPSFTTQPPNPPK